MKLYHGSDKLFKIIRPLGVNMGTRFSTPVWASYYWKDVNVARNWAIFQLTRRVGKLTVYWHLQLSKMIVPETSKNDILRFLARKSVYVYTVEVNNWSAGYGSSPDIDEYTLTGDRKPAKTDIVRLTSELVTDAAVIMSQVEIDTYFTKLKAGDFRQSRGLILSLLLDRERDMKRHDYHKLVKQGKLQPGDDLSKVTLENRPPSSLW